VVGVNFHLKFVHPFDPVQYTRRSHTENKIEGTEMIAYKVASARLTMDAALHRVLLILALDGLFLTRTLNQVAEVPNRK
jgi:hypothetical protein